jgi:tetratricopeptide (TPR) repeat protein
MSFADDLRDATDLKNQGNAFYKAGEFQKALSKYTKIFLYVNGICPSKVGGGMDELKTASTGVASPSSEEVKVAKDLRTTGNINCAATYFKLGNELKALEFLDRALEVDPENKKAIYRRGQIYLKQGDLDKATADLKKAHEAFPNDSGVAADMKTLNARLHASAVKTCAKEKSMFGGMFSRP